MKSVLISIQPKWCELIANGRKTVEVRKTKPKLETPFKVYIYCTLQGSNEFFKELKERFGEYEAVSKWNRENWGIRKGKVIGEFVCDLVKSTALWRIKGNTGFCAKRTEREELLPKMSCLSIEEIEKYAGSENRIVYGWHISNLVIYDKPRELSEFKIIGCKGCRDKDTYHCKFHCKGERKLTRPPQSWCYVESEVDTE